VKKFALSFLTILLFSFYSFSSTISHQDLYQNSHLNWVKKQDLQAKQLKEIAKSDQKIQAIFTKLTHLTHFIQKPSLDGKKYCHKEKNRTSRYLPYDENRTCREIKDFYLSASDVVSFYNHYIVAQAPLEDTLKDFWKALLYRNCTLIVTAAMPVEEKEVKAHPYWIKEEFPVKTAGWIISHSGEADTILYTKGKERIVKRQFLAFCKKTNTTRTITQLHYENWPDNDAPSFELFCKLLDEADLFPSSTKTPILVHCSAGVGRSGTFVACHSLRHEIHRQRDTGNKKALHVNIPEVVLSLRQQRKGMVATRKQLRTIYKVACQEMVD
jgi:protein tyrosine phosphatase